MYGGARKLADNRNGRKLRAINKRISKGENKLATYINRVLFNKHNVSIPKNKLFHEIKQVKHYFESSGFNLPQKLTERSLYQITKNVFWNLHHFNMEKKHHMAYKTIHTLYGHRQTLLNTFVDSIKGI